MPPKFIIDQDKENAYPFGKTFHIVPDFYEGNLIGYGLVMGVLLGTFDNDQEAQEQLSKLLNSDAKYYNVEGYSDGGTICWADEPYVLEDGECGEDDDAYDID